MKATDSRKSDDTSVFRWPDLCGTSVRRVAQTSVDSVLVVVVDVVAKKTSQVPLVDHDHVIQQFTSKSPGPALRGAVLPRTSVSGPAGLDSKLPDRLGNTIREDAVVVVDQESDCTLAREGLP